MPEPPTPTFDATFPYRPRAIPPEAPAVTGAPVASVPPVASVACVAFGASAPSAGTALAAPLPARSPLPVAWTEQLLGNAGTSTWAREGQRLAIAIGLASLFGVAIGLRVGGPAIASHAAGVSVGLLAVCGLAVPALAIVLALVNASVDGLGLARATSRAAATAGLLLAGFAPGAALFAVTVEDAITVTMVGVGGLALAGALAMRSFVRELGPQLAVADARARGLSRVALPIFLVFAATLAARIWWVTLPIVRGG